MVVVCKSQKLEPTSGVGCYCNDGKVTTKDRNLVSKRTHHTGDEITNTNTFRTAQGAGVEVKSKLAGYVRV